MRCGEGSRHPHGQGTQPAGLVASAGGRLWKPALAREVSVCDEGRPRTARAPPHPCVDCACRAPPVWLVVTVLCSALARNRGQAWPDDWTGRPGHCCPGLVPEVDSPYWVALGATGGVLPGHASSTSRSRADTTPITRSCSTTGM